MVYQVVKPVYETYTQGLCFQVIGSIPFGRWVPVVNAKTLQDLPTTIYHTWPSGFIYGWWAQEGPHRLNLKIFAFFFELWEIGKKNYPILRSVTLRTLDRVYRIGVSSWWYYLTSAISAWLLISEYKDSKFSGTVQMSYLLTFTVLRGFEGF